MSPLLAPGGCSVQQSTLCLWLLHGACLASLTQKVRHLTGETLRPSGPSAPLGDGRMVNGLFSALFPRRLEQNSIKSIPAGAFTPYKKLKRM